MTPPIPAAPGRKGGFGWLILVGALAVPGILFYSWWSHLKAEREQAVAAKARDRMPEGGIFEADPNPSKLVNPIASSSTAVAAETASEDGVAQAAPTPPAADLIPVEAGSSPVPVQTAVAAPPVPALPSLKRDPMLSPLDLLRLKEIEDRKRHSEKLLHQYKPRSNRPVASLIELKGIISGPSGEPKAIVNDEVVGAGQRVGGVLVLRITETTVTFEHKGKRFTKSVGGQ